MANKQSAFPLRRILRTSFFVPATVFSLVVLAGAARAQEPLHSLELSRAVRPWEFLPITGMRAGLLGDESGRMEAWVYPLKILREFQLKFHTEGRVLPAQALARTVTVRPESSTISYTGDTFAVQETFFVPVREQGAVILLDVETEQPFEIEAAFHRDFQLEWPAALGATYLNWVAERRAFYFGEEQRKFAAMVGSPTAADAQPEYQTNYTEARKSSFRLGATTKGKERKLIVIAGSMEGGAAAEKTYRHLAADYEGLLKESAEYYRNALAQTVSVELPDAQLQRAYDWSRVSMLQGMVTNPFLGTGLVAGYRGSGETQRPGFAWFFGRDSFWTSLALNAEGDFSNSRTALELIAKFQREDGKIPHEISQGANFVDWFKGYPYPYASADATPLYIIAANDYVVESGDTAFAKEKWESLHKAYTFLKSTYDERGRPQNFGVGHGWVEGGPLLPVKTEFYQSGLGAEALRALSNLARVTGQEEMSKTLEKNFEEQQSLVNESFWIADKKRFAFALDKNDNQVDEPSVLATVPMWFGIPNEAHAVPMIQQLADMEHQTDWGMRIISNRSPLFSGGGYHYGSVWPLFTGWASVAEYRYHQTFPAYANLRANALLALDGSLGHVTEVLSGDYYQPLATSSPHQIWSAAMVVNPLVRGLLGLATDATTGTITLAPHVPADWTFFGIRNIPTGSSKLDLRFEKDLGGITLEVKASGDASRIIDFQPAVSLPAKVLGAEFNGRPVPFRVQSNGTDQHVIIRIAVARGSNILRIRTKHDYGLSYCSTLPAIGAASQGLRILAETWTAARDRLRINVSGLAGGRYKLFVWNAQQIATVEGARLFKADDRTTELVLDFPKSNAGSASYATIEIQFASADRKREPTKR
ncbi:MAG: amylo-alpha-1,6-glucosidase [Acidobacteria bacterium]|nr:MAG: amylo-alpha-1,6-glucosidase [Acidobacteriota bacterium]PYU76292.1 MAG: amylo-alpha-1,6-glucosidase [Acidobacteriota bacterium]